MAGTTSALATTVASLVGQYLRPFDGFTVDDAGVPSFTFTPALSVAEQATYADLLVMAQSGISLSITLAEFQAIKPDIAGLRTYAGITTPTLVQTVSAVKAQSRILRALLRDG